MLPLLPSHCGRHHRSRRCRGSGFPGASRRSIRHPFLLYRLGKLASPFAAWAAAAGARVQYSSEALVEWVAR